MHKRIICSIAVIATLASSGALTWSQQPVNDSVRNTPSDQIGSDTVVVPFNSSPNTSDANSSIPLTIHSFSSTNHGPSVAGLDKAHLSKFMQLITRLRSSNDEAERSKILADIRAEVSLQFDRDLAAREKELAEIEARVARMRTQLETGRKNREATLDSLMTLVQNPKLGIGLRREWIDSIVDQESFDVDPSTKRSPNSRQGGIGTRIETDPTSETDSQK